MLRYPPAIAVQLFLGSLLIVPAADTSPDLRHEVMELGTSIARGEEDAARRTNAIASKYQLEDVMHLFKPPLKGGLDVGIGPRGIELELMELEKRLSPQGLKEKRKAIQRLGQVTVAIARVTKLYEKTEGRKDRALWRPFCEQMERDARKVIEKAVCDDPVAVRRAVDGLINSCVNCHERGASDR